MALYERRARYAGITLDLVEDLPAQVTLRAAGKNASRVFDDEAGGHRWQRVPPNEKRGRVHTSTVTVAVLPEPAEADVGRDVLDQVRLTYSRGSGPGSQHRNKTDSCVTAIHLPTGVEARCDATPSQTRNRDAAIGTLLARLQERIVNASRADLNGKRRGQVGSGMRGDKRRTIRMQDGIVTDHLTGRRWRLREYLRGEW